MDDKVYTAQLRETAKTLGCKALSGSPKQKKWAERIRRDFLWQLESEAAFLAVQSASFAQSARFWIDTREIDRKELENTIDSLVTATKAANEIGSTGAGYGEQIEIRNAALKILGMENH